VEVIWAHGAKHPSLGYKIITENTTSDGRFIFNTQLDTLLFRGWNLYVRIPSSCLENYVTSDNIWNSYYVDRAFTRFDRNQLQNVIFDFYHKADLKIKYNRASSDQLHQFAIFYNFDGKDNFFREGFETDPLSDSVTVRTAADVTTTITFRKYYYITWDSMEVRLVSDSLVCKKDANNVIEIKY